MSTTADTDTNTNNTLLEIKNVSKVFHLHTESGPKALNALNDVNLTIKSGEILSVIGESGCGKTTLGKIALRLIRPSSGKVFFDGVDIATKNPTEMKSFRKDAQMIFQNPYASLNPRRTLESTIRQPIVLHENLSKPEINDRIDMLLLDVNISPKLKKRYPHQFSGGQRQRINIARALASRPKFIVCDEAVAALDVSIQAQVLNLLLDLKDKYNLTYLFISHDLSTVEFISDRVCVMYLGKTVEFAQSDILSKRQVHHPYTQMLFDSHPVADPTKRVDRSYIVNTGDIPTALEKYIGCPFATRCVRVMDRCRAVEPELKNYGSKSTPYFIACHWVEKKST